MKKLITMLTLSLIALGLFISCDKSSPTGPGLILLDSGSFLTVDYSGPWAGNYVSNGNIYSISNYGSAVYSNYGSLAIKKLDYTSVALTLSLTDWKEYDVGAIEKLLETKTATNDSILEVSK